MFGWRNFIIAVSFLSIYLAPFAPDADAAITAPPKLSCPKNDQIRAVVRQPWHENGYEAAFALFRDDAQTAACYLINELEVVPETWIGGGDQNKHPRTMHVIWSLRALRYVTGGVNFKGKTQYRFNDANEVEANRRQFLRPEKNEVPFFAVWMSRDSLAVAPPDAQKDIIGKWNKWFRETGAGYRYAPAEGIDDWYF